MQDNEKKEDYRIRIGPLLKKVLEKQKVKIKEATWNCVDASEYEAGEILAKKILEHDLI